LCARISWLTSSIVYQQGQGVNYSSPISFYPRLSHLRSWNGDHNVATLYLLASLVHSATSSHLPTPCGIVTIRPLSLLLPRESVPCVLHTVFRSPSRKSLRSVAGCHAILLSRRPSAKLRGELSPTVLSAAHPGTRTRLVMSILSPL
jgi:hypothetical protein